MTDMKEIRVIEVKRSIFENNNQDADRLRNQLKEEKMFLLNLMSSPGLARLRRYWRCLKDFGMR